MKNLTQDYVAKRSGISTKWLGRIENGSEQVSEKILTSVSQVLEVDKEVIEHFHERPIFQNCNNSVVSGFNSNSTINYNDTTSLKEILTELNDTIESLKIILNKIDRT